jgi:hypothetical protein
MKSKISLLKLNTRAEVSRKEMKTLRMGVGPICAPHSCCACGCKYEFTGGSSTLDNYTFNSIDCLSSPGIDYLNSGYDELLQ